MPDRPIILVTGCYESRGSEFGDASLSLSNRYCEAVVEGGGLPIAFPVSGRTKDVGDYVGLSAGILLTGGEDIYPENYCEELPLAVAETVRPGSRRRDELEIALVHETLKQRKPLLAICRGHQILNVAMGGELIADLELEKPDAIEHRNGELGCRLTHVLDIESDSVAAELLGRTDVKVNSSHHQAVLQPAAGLRATARTSDSIVEVMEFSETGRLPFGVSVQFHPERFQDQNPGYRRLFERLVTTAAGQR